MEGPFQYLSDAVGDSFAKLDENKRQVVMRYHQVHPDPVGKDLELLETTSKLTALFDTPSVPDPEMKLLVDQLAAKVFSVDARVFTEQPTGAVFGPPVDLDAGSGGGGDGKGGGPGETECPECGCRFDPSKS